MTHDQPYTAIDPVCGMEVDTATAKHKSDHGGTTYYFCAPRCKRTFDADPERFIGSDPPAQPHDDEHHY